MASQKSFTLALFYCANTPGSDEQARQRIEARYGSAIRLFPLPCGGRLESLHLLKALEEFADAAYVITCPEGACRYFEGNQRAKKRLRLTEAMITAIGLEKERVGIIARKEGEDVTLESLAEKAVRAAEAIPPSPVHHFVRTLACAR